MGRPPAADAAQLRKIPIHVLTNAGERDELQRAADDDDMNVSTWMRKVSLERARAKAAEKAKQKAHG